MEPRLLWTVRTLRVERSQRDVLLVLHYLAHSSTSRTGRSVDPGVPDGKGRVGKVPIVTEETLRWFTHTCRVFDLRSGGPETPLGHERQSTLSPRAESLRCLLRDGVSPRGQGPEVPCLIFPDVGGGCRDFSRQFLPKGIFDFYWVK